MDMTIFDVIPNVGFPIVCVVALGWFIYKSYDKITKSNERREEKLYIMIGKAQEQLDNMQNTNAGFLRVLETFKKDQDEIRQDIEDIKEDIKAIPKRIDDYDCKCSKGKKKVEVEDE